MATMTLAIPDELKKDMDKEEVINWSAVAREAFRKQLEFLKILRKMQEKSDTTEEDTLQWGKEVGENLTKRLKKTRG